MGQTVNCPQQTKLNVAFICLIVGISVNPFYIRQHRMLQDSLLYSVQDGSWSHQAPIQWALEDLSPGVKQSGLEADHSYPASVEVKNAFPNMSS